ncbi:HesB/IscA family protein, partial [Wolbachia pipientis]
MGAVKHIKDPIIITERAKGRIRYLLDAKNASEKVIGLRILIKQKGCSGFKYGIEYSYDIRFLESVISIIYGDGREYKVLVDPKSIMFLLGAEMDYVEEKFSSGFVFNNP